MDESQEELYRCVCQIVTMHLTAILLPSRLSTLPPTHPHGPIHPSIYPSFHPHHLFHWAIITNHPAKTKPMNNNIQPSPIPSSFRLSSISVAF